MVVMSLSLRNCYLSRNYGILEINNLSMVFIIEAIYNLHILISDPNLTFPDALVGHVFLVHMRF